GTQDRKRKGIFDGSSNRRLNMTRISWKMTLAIATVALVLLGAGRATADPPVVSYYSPPPVVTYYTPAVAYAPAPQVSYYYAPTASYYTPSVSYYPPQVAYYAPPVSYYPAPATVTTTRYGLFGRPWVSRTYYYPW